MENCVISYFTVIKNYLINYVMSFYIENCVIFYFNMIKNYLINYVISFYNISNILIFIFLFYLLK